MMLNLELAEKKRSARWLTPARMGPALGVAALEGARHKDGSEAVEQGRIKGGVRTLELPSHNNGARLVKSQWLEWQIGNIDQANAVAIS
eukprot:CAMPEP_0206617364 /NCGR_PEP_ID=MMETSP0325_2-20121206/59559_1 /ASSEMBLY_ACC=CAM_ASM_000347 /TAXON_ID=2866 /ORGANISM="Crypthecodinium cohnii, Strain Seligo" /LENGTH=88 /DNA_ID=CAMNT_0054139269 /DNA_START=228 /DNA_END=490 /DNA_ORIENTATION=-